MLTSLFIKVIITHNLNKERKMNKELMNTITDMLLSIPVVNMLIIPSVITILDLI